MTYPQNQPVEERGNDLHLTRHSVIKYDWNQRNREDATPCRARDWGGHPG
jgi:hypothetical protein